MDKKQKLTEELKALELEVQNSNWDLKTISAKLKIAYEYEAELNIRMVKAKENTKALQESYFLLLLPSEYSIQLHIHKQSSVLLK